MATRTFHDRYGEKHQREYKERYVETALGKVRVYFGHGKIPEQFEVTYSNHLQISFEHEGCSVKIKCNKDATMWDFSADRSVVFRDKGDSVHIFHMEFKKFTAEEAISIGKELAEIIKAKD